MKTSLLSDVTICLAPTSDTPALDASVLIAQIIKKPRTWVMAHPELALTSEQQKQLDDSLARLEGGEPLPYVLGIWEFFGLAFQVTSDVLIPRPETELLVEKAIAWLQKCPSGRTVADIGTGSGAIAVSIAVNVSNVHILATDISPAALEVARWNAQKNHVSEKIEFLECDLFPTQSGLDARAFNLICANLPYIPTETLHHLPIFGREPTLALDGGKDGLDLYRRLFSLAPKWLAPHGKMLLEIESTQRTKILSIANNMFSNSEIRLHQDLLGLDRLLEIDL